MKTLPQKLNNSAGQAPRYDSGQALRLRSGQAMMVTTIFFLLISLIIIFGLTNIVNRQIKIARVLSNAQGSWFLAEAGTEDVIYRLRTGKQTLPTNFLSLNGNTATTTVTDDLTTKIVQAEANANRSVRTNKIIITQGSGASFFYGIQAGNGGFLIENNASVRGSVFSNGTVTGANSNLIRGDIISAGPSGLISGIHATGTAYAHTIQNSDIDKDAYYQVISGTTVDGTSYPGSPDQPPTSLPISDEKIEEWKAEALAGGEITTPCPYTISGATTIGPKKINCNLEISGNNYTVTLAGPLWVNGNITIRNSPTLKVAASLGNKSLPIIADNPNSRATSSKITLENSPVFEGSGEANSYVLLVSQNNSAENSGSEVAIEVKNSTSGELLVYSGHGLIWLQNSVSLREVTSYKIKISNFAEVVYKTGLANLLFTSGPGGSYVVQTWEEI